MMHNFTIGVFCPTLKPLTFLFLLFISTISLHAQKDIQLSEVEPVEHDGQSIEISLNVESMMLRLADAPKAESTRASSNPVELALPLPNGINKSFQVEETAPIAPDLVESRPDFKTYNLYDSRTNVFAGRLFVSPFGVNGLLFTHHGTVSIQPLDMHNPVIHKIAYDHEAHTHSCEIGHEELSTFSKKPAQLRSSFTPNGANKRTYRMAIVTTGEFYQNYGTMAAADAAVVSAVNNINAIYLRELATEFTIVGPEHATDPNTDNFDPTQSNGVSRTAQAAAVVGENWTTSEYDLGHALHHMSSGGSGVASLGVVCRNFSNPIPNPSSGSYNYTTGGVWKGRGWSGGNAGASWFAGLFAHEIGHMFNAPHTFNGSGGSCSSNISSTSSYEIASGTTIMSYNGICSSAQNIPSSGAADDYFHSKTLETILAYMNGLGNCPVSTASGNQPPNVEANTCGGTYTVPKLTPFSLTGTGSDPDGDQIYYCWEQIDEDGSGTPTQGYIGTTAGNSAIAPLFRSYPPSTSPVRNFPILSTILGSSNVSNFEPLPNAARTMNFRLTGRDFQANGGLSCSDVAVTVDGSSGPLEVTSPNGGENWSAGTQTITWNVNNTNTVCANVDILMSIDGGQSFPITLATNTGNDGSASVNIPSVSGVTNARIKVRCKINDCFEFFDISNGDFSFTSLCAAEGSVVCPTASVSLPASDPGLNLTMENHFGGLVTQNTFATTGASPTGPLANATNSGGSTCQTPWGTEKYDEFDFTVDATGTYSFSNTSGGQIIYSVFEANGYNPAAPCSGTFIGSNATGAISWSTSASMTLTACTKYKMVVWTLFSANNSATITMSGAGAIYESGPGPGSNYSYTYAAVNTSDGEIDAFSATADFTTLNPGSYQIYGMNYKTGGSTPPANVNPTNLIGMTISAILGAGNCVNFSANYRPVTVTGTLCPSVSDIFINEFHYDDDGADENEFVEVAVLNSSSVTLADITLTLYNGADGTSYDTHTLDSFTEGTDDGTYTYYSKDITGIQDGAPDGLALSCNGSSIEFLSYEGSFTATNGDANGETSTDVGVSESSTSPSGTSIQKISNAWYVTCGQNTEGAANVLPTLSVAATNATQAEGNAGNTAFTFTVTRGGVTTGTTEVNYAVTGTGANPANADDFGGSLPSGSVSFAASETSKVITINVSGDTDSESDETFTVTISNPTGCSTNITSSTAEGTIQNDDCTPQTWYRDMDDDGYGDAGTTTSTCTQPTGYVADNTDCDDNDEDEFPNQVWYLDADGDDYSEGTSVTQCERPANYFTAAELVATSGDCDDSNAAVNPGATEICNGIDDDCDGQTDEGLLTTYYQDSDDDGFGNPAVSQDACSQPMGYVTDNTDCDDTDENEFPGQVWYLDADGDDYSEGTSLTQCERPSNYYTAAELIATSGDCDDSNAAVNPGATEICNGIDDDCDGQTDEGLLTTYYQDSDDDGFGNPAVTQGACSQPTGYVTDNTDCDDTDENEFPGQVWYLDADGDDYSEGTFLTQCERPTNYYLASELIATSGDCDDSNAAVNPGATEICNGIDDDCDNEVDEDGLTTYYQDSDDDGFGNPAISQDACSQPAGYVLDNTDCDDTDENEFPNQVWYLDADGDDYSEGTSVTQCERPANYFTAAELVATSGDCDDSNAAVNPGATEICNGIDDDCDGQTDEGLLTTYYQDSDDDGFGNPAVSQTACSQPVGYVLDNTDCDDTDENEFPNQVWYKDVDGDDYSDGMTLTQCERPLNYYLASELIATSGDCDDNNSAVNPGATEVCNGVDDDCDGMTDETGGPGTWYADSDNDGYGDPAVTQVSCTQPAGYVMNDDDCDDTDMNVNPGATEICNGIDDNCDGNTDEGLLTTYYQDSDDDGYGNAAVSQTACSQPVGYVLDNTDCDDTDENEFPGQVWYLDADGDDYSEGTFLTQCERPANYFTAAELIATSGDCDDSNAVVNPGATELCNGIDDDCDGNTDEGLLTTYYQDSDDDGFGNAAVSQNACSQPVGYVTDNTDCDDTDGDEFPGQVWYKDVDGDDYSDGTTLTQCERPSNYYLASELIATSGDCDDSNAAVNPGATEVCNGIDDDCNGNADEGVTDTYYQDSDDDGYGNPAISLEACTRPAGYVGNGNDCDDTDEDEFPGQTWYKDADGDDYSDGSTLTQCERPANYYLASELIATSGDCDDSNAAVNPGATEVCNGIDDDCDGMVDETGGPATWYADSDVDGYGDPMVTQVSCTQPAGYVLNADDCDDSNMAVNPAATEICNGIDDNCDGNIDEGVQTIYYQDSDDDGFGNAAVTQMACSQPMGYVLNNTDCDDTDEDEFPGQTWYKDADGDDYSDGSTLTQCERPANYYLASELIATSGDCDDSNGAVNPGATEICNGIDDNCVGGIDEGVQTIYYQDSDDDGFGNAAVTQMACSQPMGYVLDNTDCDDMDEDEFPGQTWYKDADGDDYSDGTFLTQCERPANYYTAAELVATSGDCDDSNGAVNPGATEICNGIDDNCVGGIDEGVQTTYYQDSDDDGFGNAAVTQMACSQPMGYVLDNTDCDDTDEDEFPGQVWYLDADGDDYSDGTSITNCERLADYYTAAELIATSGDCDDSNSAVNPSATEICNGIDDNCDGNIDEICCSISNILLSNVSPCDNSGTIPASGDDIFTADVTVFFVNPATTGTLDLSGDGTASVAVGALGATSYTFTNVIMSADGSAISLTAEFSDDGLCTYTDINTGTAPEPCSDPCTINIDGVTVTDETCPDQEDGIITAVGSSPNAGQIGYSIDGGINFNFTGVFTNLEPGTYTLIVRLFASPSCETTTTVTVGAAPASALQTWYKDWDDDGYSNGVTLVSCDQPPGFKLAGDLIATSGDCNDFDPNEFPGQVFYLDADEDGYSDGTSVSACQQPADYYPASELTATSGDCDDSDETIYPGAPEICDGLDNDCDGDVDEGAVGGLTFVGNITFTTQAQVDAFSQCYSIIDGHLTIKNANITDISNLMNLEEVTKSVKIQSTGLASLTGLDNLTTVGQTLTVKFNNDLTTLDGLDAVTTVGNSLQVFRNSILTDCCAIHDLISNGGVGGAITIMRNDTGCDSETEINTACVGSNPLIISGGSGQNTVGASVENFMAMSLFPNPAKEEVNIQILAQYEQGMIQIFDQMGKTVWLEKLPEDAPEYRVNVGKWDAGVYFIRLDLDGQTLTQKLMVK